MQHVTPKEIWGELNIVHGSIPDAPRRISLWQDKTTLGRDPARTFKGLGTCYATAHCTPLGMEHNMCTFCIVLLVF